MVYVLVFLATRHVGSQLPDQGLNPHSLHCERRKQLVSVYCVPGVDLETGIIFFILLVHPH